MASEGEHVEDMRYELGRDAAQRGDQIHETASEEFKRGYESYRSFSSFGSNVSPRKFGKGSRQREPWTCVCGTENKRYLNQCWMCGIRREEALIAGVE